MEHMRTMLLCLNGSSPMCNQLCRTRPDDSLATEAYLLAPMELEHRPCEAQLAGSCLWLRSTCYATGGLGAATVLVQFSRPQSSLVLSLKRKYNQTCSAALPRAQLFPPEKTAAVLPRANPLTPPTVPVPCATSSTEPDQTIALLLKHTFLLLWS